VTTKALPHPTDSDWARLLDAERGFEAEIAAAESTARSRIEEARKCMGTAFADPAAVEALAAAEQQADAERHTLELRRIAEVGEAAAAVLDATPEAVIDALARHALAAALTGELPAAEDR